MNKAIIIVPVVLVSIFLIVVLLNFSTEVAERQAFANVELCGYDVYLDGFSDWRADVCLENTGNIRAVLDYADIWLYDGDNLIGTIDLPTNLTIEPYSSGWADTDITFSGFRGMLSAIRIDNPQIQYCVYFYSSLGEFEECGWR